MDQSALLPLLDDWDPVPLVAALAPADPKLPVVVAAPCALANAAEQVSIPLLLENQNAVRVTLVVATWSGLSGMAVGLQQGNDACSWRLLGGGLNVNSAGLKTFVVTGIGGRFVRLRYGTAGTGLVVFKAVVRRYRA